MVRSLEAGKLAIVGLLLLSVPYFTAPIACSSRSAGETKRSAPTDGTKKVIRISRPGYVQIDNWLKQKTAQFEALHPDVTVIYEPTPGEEYLIKLRTMLSVGTAPDAYTIAGQWVPDFAEQNLMAIPPPEIQAGLRRDYVPAAVEYCSYGGIVYGYPYEGGSRIILYNKDIFRREGIEQLPRDWAEFTSVAVRCTKFDRYGRMIQEGFGLYGPGHGPHAVCSFAALVWSNGGRFMDEDTNEIYFTERPFVEALRFLTDLHLKYKAASLQFIPFNEGFAVGRVAMIVGGPWLVAYYREKVPDLDFGGFLIPPPRRDMEPVVDNSPWVWVVNPASGRRREVWEFLEFIQSRDSQVDFAKQVGLTPYRIDSLEDPFFQNDPVQRAFAESVKYVRMRPRRYWFQIERLLGAQIELALLGVKSPEEALRDAEEDIKRQILTHRDTR